MAMKRRRFNLLGAVSAGALAAGVGIPKRAHALTTADAETLKTTLTPLGAERAGNADGSIPAWTGENLPLPPGGGPYGLLPDYFAADAKIVTINAANMAQYQDRLAPGIQTMLTKYPDFRIDVYPSHRTAIAPQQVYDAAYANVTSAQPVAGGSRLGFTGAIGAFPFPILNQTDPFEGGAQAMWNHCCRWAGAYDTRNWANHTMIDGQLVLASGYILHRGHPLYYPGVSADSYNGWSSMSRFDVWGPPETKGQSYLEYEPTNPTAQPVEIWEYLNGQGRVRKAPELQYDTPSSQNDDVQNYDESDMFLGALLQYDWKLVGKKEMYIPYNNNKLTHATAAEALTPNFVNPDYVRWELHRVWVVEATLHPGNRNVLPHRFFYIDEDTYQIALGHAFDAQGNMFHVSISFFENRPDIPGTTQLCTIVFNIQSGQYATTWGVWNESPLTEPYILSEIPPDWFQPTAMAASQQY
jgi:hypothetical protein